MPDLDSKLSPKPQSTPVPERRKRTSSSLKRSARRRRRIWLTVGLTGFLAISLTLFLRSHHPVRSLAPNVPETAPPGKEDLTAAQWITQGDASVAKGDFDSAVASYSQAIRLQPLDPGTVYRRGVALLGKRDLNNSIADFNEAIRLAPRFRASFL